MVYSKGQLLIQDNADAEEIEYMVMQLHEQNSLLASILREQYLTEGTKQDKAKRHCLSYAQYRVLLDKELLGYGLSIGKIAKVLGYFSHLGLYNYVKKRNLK